MQNSLNLDCLLKPNAVHLTENAGEFSDRPLRNTWRAHFMERRLNEAAAAADASRGLTGQLRCPKTKSAYHVRCQLNTHISNCPAKLKAASFKRPYPQ